MAFYSTLLALALAIFSQCQLSAQSQFAEHDPMYKLQSNDVIEVRYAFTPEYNTTAKVQPDGYVALPLTGPVKVSGLTAENAAAAIQTKASTQLRDPEVTVLIKEFVAPSFVVAGEVSHPGTFELHGPMNAIQAIATSGGFKDSSQRTQVILIRKVNPEFARVTVLDMKRLMSPKGVTENPDILPGDMLIVPQNVVSKLEPYIRWSTSALYGAAILR
jgi:protein involved in polysaccharide export with SLBB domain